MPTLPVSRPFVRASMLIATALLWTSAVQAQDSTTSAPPAHLAAVTGAATVERDGSIEPASVNAPIIAGDQLRTTAGRVELLFPGGTALDIDENSSLDVLSPTLIRLIAGRALLSVAGANDPSSAVRYQIDTPAASARTDGPGEYRVAALGGRDDGETELAVVRGVADLVTERGTVAVRAGERSVALENGAPAFPQTFNSARFDAFDRWTVERRNARTTGASAQYLPRDLQMYGGALDRSGSWQYAAPYGYVWHPSVAASWRPYYYGNWSPIRSYGWTWIGFDVWSWPTHHYGRWGYARGGWFWIPGRAWAPAWVSWAVAPGYVSWCPLGFDGRPVFALSIGAGDPWLGWVVVPRQSFGYRNDDVRRYAIAAHQLPRTTPFIVQAVAPVAVPRFASRQSTVDGRRAAVDGRRDGVDRRPSEDLARRSNSNDQQAVRRTGSVDPARTFRQPLPERTRETAADRTRAAQPSLTPGTPGRGPAVDPRLPTDDPPALGVGRRPRFGEVSPKRDDASGRAEADRRLPTLRPRAPEVAAPRYRTPAPDPPARSDAPSPGVVHRGGLVDRSSSVTDSRGVTAVPRSAPERRVEGSSRREPSRGERRRQ